MKLLIISDAWFPQVNGVVRTYENISRELRKIGYDVKVIGPNDFPKRMPMPGYSEIKLALFPYKRLCKYIKDFAPDRIHVSTEGPLGWAGRKYCLNHAIPFSTSFHTMFPDYVAKRFARFTPALYGFWHNLGIKYVRNFHEPSSNMFVATQSLEDQLKEWDFKTPMHRLTRGADLDQFRPLAIGEEKTLYKDLKAPIAIYVGRIAIEKNIEAFLEMEWQGSKIVIGEGPSKDELQAQFPDAIFAGKHEGEDLAAHYRCADIFVFPSRTDTFGMVIVEALACGLPVAAYNATGPKDIIINENLGVLTEDNLAAAAQKALTIGDPQTRAAYVKNFHTWEYVAKQFDDALKNKIGCAKPKT